MLSPTAHRLARIAAVMVEYEVDFVVVGGYAIEVQMAADGTSIPYPPTQDIDIAPNRDLANLERLVAALETLDAGIRTEVGRFEMRHVAEDFRGTGLRNFTCEYGDFDLAFEPAEMGTYDDMLPTAVAMQVPVGGSSEPVHILCADLASIYRSKASLDRPKDARALDFLEDTLALQPRSPSAADPPAAVSDDPDDELVRLRRKIEEIQRRAGQQPTPPVSGGLSL